MRKAQISGYELTIICQVREAIKAGKHLDLLEHDQLKQEKLAGHAFIGFHEADITFPPTYKFDPGFYYTMITSIIIYPSFIHHLIKDAK